MVFFFSKARSKFQPFAEAARAGKSAMESGAEKKTQKQL